MRNERRGMTRGERTGILIVALLTIAFVCLKLTDLIAWSWFWVLSPIWITVLVLVILIIVAVILYMRDAENEN